MTAFVLFLVLVSQTPGADGSSIPVRRVQTVFDDEATISALYNATVIGQPIRFEDYPNDNDNDNHPHVCSTQTCMARGTSPSCVTHSGGLIPFGGNSSNKNASNHHHHQQQQSQQLPAYFRFDQWVDNSQLEGGGDSDSPLASDSPHPCCEAKSCVFGYVETVDFTTRRDRTIGIEFGIHSESESDLYEFAITLYRNTKPNTGGTTEDGIASRSTTSSTVTATTTAASATTTATTTTTTTATTTTTTTTTGASIEQVHVYRGRSATTTVVVEEYSLRAGESYFLRFFTAGTKLPTSLLDHQPTTPTPTLEPTTTTTQQYLSAPPSALPSTIVPTASSRLRPSFAPSDSASTSTPSRVSVSPSTRHDHTNVPSSGPTSVASEAPSLILPSSSSSSPSASPNSKSLKSSKKKTQKKNKTNKTNKGGGKSADATGKSAVGKSSVTGKSTGGVKSDSKPDKKSSDTGKSAGTKSEKRSDNKSAGKSFDTGKSAGTKSEKNSYKSAGKNLGKSYDTGKSKGTTSPGDRSEKKSAKQAKAKTRIH